MGMSKRVIRKYTEEFKEQAVALSYEIGATKAARRLGISDANVHNWRAKLKAKGIGPVGAKESEQQEVKRLRAEVAELKKVNQILKAAAAFFSQGHLK